MLRLMRRVMETEPNDGYHRDLATAPLLDPTEEAGTENGIYYITVPVLDPTRT